MHSPEDNLAPSPWSLWQLIDSAFPTGGFAHSGGLEAAVQLGRVTDAPELRAFALAALAQAAALSAPFVVTTVDAPPRYAELDAIYHALLRNTISSAASRTQGQAMVSIACDAWGNQALRSAKAALRGAAWNGHWPIAFGLAASAVGADATLAADAFLFATGRAILSAAVRLNLVGPREAQRLQAELSSARGRLLDVALSTGIDDACQTSPVLEMLQAQQGRLYSKLFVS